jgi:hypothetical protein
VLSRTITQVVIKYFAIGILILNALLAVAGGFENQAFGMQRQDSRLGGVSFSGTRHLLFRRIYPKL